MKIRIPALVVALSLLAGCASYDGRGLKPGISTAQEVSQLMGEPAQRWKDPDGSQLWAYPRGPAGYQTYMVRIDRQGVMTSLQGVLDMRHFAKIQAAMTQEEVLRTIGPPQPEWTVYFDSRDELVWEWRYCDDWNEASRFDVLFDNTSGKVRSTQSRPESSFKRFPTICGH